jgi:cellobiose phosphorylase
MGGVATDEQVGEILRAADHYLFDPKVGGYRLNTNFGDMLFNMGRCFGYAYGHKENGAVFSHMAVMFAYGLYVRGQARAAYRALDSLYQLAVDFPTSRMYPGLPEYFSDRGRGMYPYLTGSASWYLLTLVTQAFGVRGQRGDLVLEPKLVREQFGADGCTALSTIFAGHRLKVVFHNPAGLDYGAYHIQSIALDGTPVQGEWQTQAILPRAVITALDPQIVHQVDIQLDSK